MSASTSMSSTSSSSGVVYVNPKLADEYICCICLEIASQVVDIGCPEQHIFDAHCVKGVLKDSEGNFPCPMCRHTCNSARIAAMPFVQRMIGKLQVKCPNFVACVQPKQEEQPEIQSVSVIRNRKNGYVDVSDICDDFDGRISGSIHPMKQEDPITGVNAGCPWRGVKMDLASHLTACMFAKIGCLLCNESDIYRCDLSRHQRQDCPETLIKCTYVAVGCRGLLKRGLFDNHLTEYRRAHSRMVAEYFGGNNDDDSHRSDDRYTDNGNDGNWDTRSYMSDDRVDDRYDDDNCLEQVMTFCPHYND